MTTTSIDDVVKSIASFANSEGIPIIIENDWNELNKKYTKEEIKKGFAKYISENYVLFPFRKISLQDVETKFIDLNNTGYSNFIMNDPGFVVEKYDDYKYPFSLYGKFVISFGHYHNDISNYFQQRNRYDCGSHGFFSPNEIWYSEQNLEKMNWTFWRMENQGINYDKIRGSFRLGAYVATQFKPHVAKTLYDYVYEKTSSQIKTVLDISMGWGDRLAGFYTSKMNRYIGTDPNPNVFRVYKQQCIHYEKLLSGVEPTITDFQIEKNGHIYDAFKCIGESGKEVISYNCPAEDILEEIKSESYDCVFTSPPYFSTELYDEGGDDWKQSWFRYPEYDNWWKNFYKPVLEACYESLKEDGVMMMNIMDPQIKRKRFKTCDQMVDYILSIGGKFDGQIGMRYKQRPKNIDKKLLNKHLLTTYIENIWCFSKNGFDISFKHATLEGLFGE